MKKFLLSLFGFTLIVGTIHAFANISYDASYWLFFQDKNESLFNLIVAVFSLGFFTGMFLMLAFAMKKPTDPDTEF